MKKSNIAITLVSSALVLGLSAATLLHASPGEYGNKGSCKHQRLGKHKEERFDKMVRKLDLTEQQVSDAQALRAKNEELVDKQKARLETIRVELSGIGFGKEYDKERVEQLVSEQSEIRAQLSLLRISGMNDLYGILTPEQQAKMNMTKDRWLSHRHH